MIERPRLDDRAAGVASAVVALAGVGVFVLSVVAVVASVRSFVAAFGFDLGA